MHLPHLVPFALALLAGPLFPQDAAQRARTLFVANCAACHGENGDGQGTTQLDRPARSFKDGGFSFGNTPEALFKTISVGIPGSPMAGFDASLSEEERKLLADYVVTLGPPIEEVKLEDTILNVRERPLVVRGLLPPLADGLPSHPRGLLIGDPSGITFEYQVDDVRLLALRQGGFVRRTDWTGRGGTPLEPLGKVVHLLDGGTPDALFRQRADQPLQARLSATHESGGSVSIEYHLVGAAGEVSHVTEVPSVVSLPFGTGFSRRFTAVGADLELFGPRPGGEVSWLDPWRTLVATAAEHAPVLMTLRSSEGRLPHLQGTEEKRLRWVLEGGADKKAEIELTTVLLVRWDDDVQKQVDAWLGGR